MRNVSIQELEDHIPDLEAGQRLTLLHRGKPLAEVIPISTASEDPSEPPVRWKSEEERLAAIADFMAFLRKGWDLGGLKITDRDALYDRDK